MKNLMKTTLGLSAALAITCGVTGVNAAGLAGTPKLSPSTVALPATPAAPVALPATPKTNSLLTVSPNNRKVGSTKFTGVAVDALNTAKITTASSATTTYAGVKVGNTNLLVTRLGPPVKNPNRDNDRPSQGHTVDVNQTPLGANVN